MSGRNRALVAAAVVWAVLAGACQSEPSPTVAQPPNPTSAPTSLLTGCLVDPGTPAAAAPGAEYKIAQPGILTIGSLTNFAPFETLRAGAPSGFDIDLIAEIAHRLGLRPEIVRENDQAALLRDVASAKTDVAISALDIIPPSKAVVDFTDPYFTADLALSVGADRARSVSSLSALSGAAVGVARGSFGRTCANALSSAQHFSIREYSDISQAFTDLSVGRIGAVLTDLPTSLRLVQAVTGLQMVAIYQTRDTYGIAVAKSNPNLRQALNRVLADMNQDGTYRIIYEKWFQVPPP